MAVIHFADGLAEQLAPVITLTGVCNRCGLCCVEDVEGVEVVCEHLEASKVGQADGTRCKAYQTREDGMPITMRSDDGRVVVDTRCAKDSEAETAKILTCLGRGCSLTVEGR